MHWALLAQFQGVNLVFFVLPLTGVGIGMIIIAALVAVYYNVIIAWAIYYLIRSCTTGPLPWSTCDNEWNTANCFNDSMNYTKEETVNLTRPSDEYWQYENIFLFHFFNSLIFLQDRVVLLVTVKVNLIRPSNEYWQYIKWYSLFNLFIHRKLKNRVVLLLIVKVNLTRPSHEYW